MPVRGKLPPEDRRQFTYLEAFGRTLAGIAPWLQCENLDPEEEALRDRTRDLALRCLDVAFNPACKDKMNVRRLPDVGLPGCRNLRRQRRREHFPTMRKAAGPWGQRTRNRTRTTGCSSARPLKPFSVMPNNGLGSMRSTVHESRIGTWAFAVWRWARSTSTTTTALSSINELDVLDEVRRNMRNGKTSCGSPKAPIDRNHQADRA